MGLPKRPGSLAYNSFQEWVANHDQNQHQPRQHVQHAQPISPPSEEEDNDDIVMLSPDSSSRNALVTLS